MSAHSEREEARKRQAAHDDGFLEGRNPMGSCLIPCHLKRQEEADAWVRGFEQGRAGLKAGAA